MALTHGSGAARSLVIGLHAVLAASLIAVAAAHVGARAQSVGMVGGELEAQIKVVSLSPPRVQIVGERAAPSKSWSFRNAYAGMLGLAERIENLTLADERGASVSVRKIAPGEYEAARPATRFAYEVKLDPPADNNNAPHVSWLTETHGLLMTGDLLPLPHAGARLSVRLPQGWDGTMPPITRLGYSMVTDAGSGVFLVGSGLRRERAKVRDAQLLVAFVGDWAFEDKEAAGLVAQISNEHARAFDGAPRAGATVIIAPHPRPATPSQWSAEVRGETLTLLTGRAPARQSALARLTGPLAHELFHLWVPNGLNLSGDYAWFYEGFANYQALRVGVRLGHLSFNDYLDALARTHDAYGRAAARDDVSLVEASARRWGSSNALVYHKGALVALLYDLELRRRTGGKRSLDDALRRLFGGGSASPVPADGNAAVTAALEATLPDGSDFTRRYVRSVHKINLADELRPYGLVVATVGARTRIAVSESLSGSQRALLRQIGYN